MQAQREEFKAHLGRKISRLAMVWLELKAVIWTVNCPARSGPSMASSLSRGETVTLEMYAVQ